MPEAKKDPRLVAASVLIYQRLVALYPRSFRDEYARPMVQVFRDRSLDTQHREGVTGLPPLWAETLFDLIKTATEEHLQRGTTMTRDTFIRLSGWAMMVGVVLIVVAFAGLADETTIRVMLYDLLGAPATASSYYQIQSISSAAPLVIVLGGLSFVTLGLLGLQLRYGRLTGQLGELCLWISIASGALATLMVVSGASGSELPWTLFSWSMVAMLLFLGLYGIVAMPRGNILPLLAGLSLGLAYLLAVVTNGAEALFPWWVEAMLLLPAACLIALGFVLATSPTEDSQRHDAVTQVPAA